MLPLIPVSGFVVISTKMLHAISLVSIVCYKFCFFSGQLVVFNYFSMNLGLPEVLSVRPEADYSSGNKNYGIGNQTGVSLFDHGTVKHWMVRIDKPGVWIVTKAQMVDHCVQLLSKVLWK